MELYQGEIYHIYNRGNIHQKVFYERDNYLFFLEKMNKHIKPYCHFLAWCLMPNHFHWLVKVKNQLDIESSSKSHDTLLSLDPGKTGLNPSDKWIISQEATLPDLNKNIGVLLRSFTRAMNIRYQSKGSLFQQRTNSKNVNPGKTIRDNYALICFLYILQNPVRNKLTDNIANWEFSSYRDYAGLRNGNLCNIDLAISLFDLPSSHQEFQKFANQTLPDHFQDYIF